jgi:hypothetical protein
MACPENPTHAICKEVGAVCMDGPRMCTCQASGALGPLMWRCESDAGP